MTRELRDDRRHTHAFLAAVLVASAALLPAARADNAAPPSAQQQIDALAGQLAAVLAQVRELAEQNKQLLERQQQLERQLSSALPGTPAVASAAR